MYIFLSAYNFHEIEELWENNNLIKTNIPNIISRNKYREINKYFYIYHNCSILTPDINKDNKTDKINEHINHVNAKWIIMYLYTKYLTIDESVASYKGKFYFK